MISFRNVYENKKIAIIGNTGFKGSWLTVWLLDLGADVYGISNNIPTEPSHFKAARLSDRIRYIEADIRDAESIRRLLHQIQPDFVFHLAAQALVRRSYQEPLLTFHTNVLGTVNILEALRALQTPCNAVIITSDKCYDNVEWVWGYRETDALGGKDPYSASKGGAELAIRGYACSYFAEENSHVKVAVGRAGNVIGGGDWAMDRIVPDCVRAWSQSKEVEIRNPDATRPWQHVLEPLSGYLVLGAHLAENRSLNGEAFNFGPPANQNPSVRELIEVMDRYWDNTRWKDVSKKESQAHEAEILKLCCDKALHMLQWEPTLNFQETVRFTANWYRHFYESSGTDIFKYSCQQILEYVASANAKGIAWTR